LLPSVFLSSDFSCTVCLEPIAPSKKAMITILCNHVFHLQCLAKWGLTLLCFVFLCLAFSLLFFLVPSKTHIFRVSLSLLLFEFSQPTVLVLSVVTLFSLLSYRGVKIADSLPICGFV
jgi:hypothetical protein